METSDDAAIYKIQDDLALVLTVDFITPVVDDAYTFGQIAAANALSDVYAKGGKAIAALNIVCFPGEDLPWDILRQTMEGGLSKLKEAQVPLAGGHSVDDKEFKFGFSITGLIHPKKVLRNQGAKPGDLLILTKPLGVGILNTAIKGGLASEKAKEEAILSMTTLNQKASEIMLKYAINASTDITGFGFIGHAAEMIQGTATGMHLFPSEIPYFEDAREYAEMGLLPAGLYRNRDFRKDMVDFAPSVPLWLNDILHDPQTSGGLLLSVERKDAHCLLQDFHDQGVSSARIIGEITNNPGIKIV